MSWRIATTHVSTYRYKTEVISSYNETRMSPVSSKRQTVLESQISTSPASSTFHYRDYFGTSVYSFDLHQPHDVLTITSQALVETTPPRPLDYNVSWDQLRRSDVRDTFCEYLSESQYVDLNAETSALSERFSTLSTPTAAAVEICSYLQEQLTYLPGSTSVTTTATDVLRQRSGVCQDFAHLALRLLRNLGVPARYVSGYLYPLEEVEIGDRHIGESHAWIEIWLGGWYGLDPTNGAEVGERHVTVAKGRDYADVKPFHGIYHGGELKSLTVTVELVRLA
jgi:transglutaminase-like putative cysteine protease